LKINYIFRAFFSGTQNVEHIKNKLVNIMLCKQPECPMNIDKIIVKISGVWNLSVIVNDELVVILFLGAT